MALDRQLILSHAFAQVNEGGLESLTLRRLAARLDVQAPAIYWHFRNKKDLLDEMGTQVLREAYQSGPIQDLPWRDWAAELCALLRRTLLGYREGARMVSGTYLTDASLFEGMETNLRKLTGAGFTLRQSVVALTSLYCFTIGFVIEEQGIQLAPGEQDERYTLAHREARIGKDRFPLAVAAGAEMFQDHDRGFRAGVELLVSGMAAQLAASASN